MRLIVLNEQMEERIEKIEAVISNLVRNSEDLSDIVAAQDKEISRITSINDKSFNNHKNKK